MSKRKNSEQGVYIVLFSALMLGLVALLALVLGLGLIATDSTRMQQFGNVTALSALQEYLSQKAYFGNQYDRRSLTRARDRANAILRMNTLIGSSTPFGSGTTDGIHAPWEGPGGTGVMRVGKWYQSDPGTNPCTDPTAIPTPGSYPCFIPTPDLAGPDSSNAIRLELNTESSNPVISPFAFIFGNERFSLKAEATATVVERCVAYLPDISFSAAEETHYLPPPNPYENAFQYNYPGPFSVPGDGTPNGVGYDCYSDYRPYTPESIPYRVTCPRQDRDGPPPGGEPPALFAYRVSSLVDPPGTAPNSMFHYYSDWCRLASSSLVAGYQFNVEGTYWCNLLFRDYDPLGGQLFDTTLRVRRPGFSSETDVTRHYYQDYGQTQLPSNRVATLLGTVMIDRFIDPKPLADFFLAFNAGLRYVRQNASSNDRATIMPFAGQLRNPYPHIGVTDRFDLLLQLTNMNLRGKRTGLSSTWPYAPMFAPSVSPNFVEMGWFPVLTDDFRDSKTFLVDALQQAINRLRSSCSATSQKVIVIATDGISSCADTNAAQYSGAIQYTGPWDPTPPDNGPVNCPRSARPDVRYGNYLAAVRQLINADPTTNSILNQARQAQIAITVLLRGSAVDPNFIERTNPQGGYFTPKEAFAYGIPISDIFDATPTTNPPGGSDQDAFMTKGQPGVSFRNPNFVMGSLALLTGGIPCPLLDSCQYPSDCPACTVPCEYGMCTGCYGRNGPDPEPWILRPCARANGTRRSCSVVNESTGAQAAKCVGEALGGNPFILVH